MKINICEFTAKQLRSIHKDHLGFLIASSHCCNELTAVMAYHIFEHDPSIANVAECSFIQIRFYTLIRLQIGKIFEYRDLCNKYVGLIRKTFPAMGEKISTQSREISRKIDSAKWSARMRNKVAFHFDTEYPLQALERLPNDHRLNFLFGSIRGLTAFDFADYLINEEMFFDAGEGDPRKGAEIVKEWTTDLRLKILRFHAGVTKDLFAQYGLMQNLTQSEIREQYCSSRGLTFIPIAPLIDT